MKKIGNIITLEGLEIDFTKIPRIEYRKLDKTWIARLFIEIPDDSESIYSKYLKKVGYVPINKDPLWQLKYVLLKDRHIEAIARYFEDYLYIIGTIWGVKKTYDYFLTNGVFYKLNSHFAMLSKAFKFLAEHMGDGKVSK